MKLDKKNKIQDNIQLYHDKNGLNIYNPDFFLTFSDFNISDIWYNIYVFAVFTAQIKIWRFRQ